jgi:hypothetical protein
MQNEERTLSIERPVSKKESRWHDQDKPGLLAFFYGKGEFLHNVVLEQTCSAVQKQVLAGRFIQARVIIGAPAIAKQVAAVGFFAGAQI